MNGQQSGTGCIVRGVAFGLTLLAVGGCDRAVSREQLTKEVLQKDSEFSWVLDRHRALVNRIETYERELALKRSTVEQNIAQMRKDLVASTENVQGRIAEVKKQMEPEVERLGLALSLANEELRVRQFQRASLGRSIAQLRKAGKSAQTAWTEAERARGQEKIDEMLRDAKRIDHEIASLKAHMRLLKIKLLLIRF